MRIWVKHVQKRYSEWINCLFQEVSNEVETEGKQVDRQLEERKRARKEGIYLYVYYMDEDRKGTSVYFPLAKTPPLSVLMNESWCECITLRCTDIYVYIHSILLHTKNTSSMVCWDFVYIRHILNSFSSPLISHHFISNKSLSRKSQAESMAPQWKAPTNTEYPGTMSQIELNWIAAWYNNAKQETERARARATNTIA